jgi:hypothetical protein
VLDPGFRGCAWLNAAVHPVTWLVGLTIVQSPVCWALRFRQLMALYLVMLQNAADCESAASQGIEKGLPVLNLAALDPGHAVRFAARVVASTSKKTFTGLAVTKYLIDLELQKSPKVRLKEYLVEYVKVCAAMQFAVYSDPFDANAKKKTFNHISTAHESMSFSDKQRVHDFHPLQLVDEFYCADSEVHKEFKDLCSSKWRDVRKDPILPAPIRQDDMPLVLLKFAERAAMQKEDDGEPLLKYWLQDVWKDGTLIVPRGKADLESGSSDDDECDEGEEDDQLEAPLLHSTGAGRPPARLTPTKSV